MKQSAHEQAREVDSPDDAVLRMTRGTRSVRRIFALSDIHVDHEENRVWIENIPAGEHAADALILAGDVSSDLGQLHDALDCLKRRFAEVFFVPGNHELWVRRHEGEDSWAKFHEVLKVCSSVGVHTRPGLVTGDCGKWWIVPLFSWYRRPEEGDKSLYVEKNGECNLDIWADDHFIRWRSLAGGTNIADVFLRMNELSVLRRYDAPVISFSHFLPRRELMFWTKEEAGNAPHKGTVRDPNPGFNFSRVAGCAGLERQIRLLNSKIHVYGHQHRNRDRVIDGVRYVSHCLGYPEERNEGQIWNLGDRSLVGLAG